MQHSRTTFPRRLALLAILVPFAACERVPEPQADETAQPPAAPAPEQPAAPAPGAPGPVGAPTPDLLHGIEEYVRSRGATALPPFRFASLDLNDDGRLESIVLLDSPQWCQAGGCTMLIFRGDDEGALLITTIPAAGEPVRVSTERTAGWRNLIVRAPGNRDVVLRFDGTGYPADVAGQPEATADQASAAQPLALQQVQQPTTTP